MRVRATVGMVLVFALLAAAPALRAEDDNAKEDPEAKIEKEEEETLAKLDTEVQSTLRSYVAKGKLLLDNSNPDAKPAVLGSFLADGKTYQVKIEREGLREELRPFDGKEVQLEGKLRVNGKYFVVHAVAGDKVGAPVGGMQKSRGL